MSESVDVSAVLSSEEVPQVEATSEVVVEEVPEVSEEVASETVAPEEVAEEEEVASETVAPEPEVEEEVPVVPSTQEVVQNVQEMLSSTDTSGSVNELENRVKVLEEAFISLVGKILNKEKVSPTIISQILP